MSRTELGTVGGRVLVGLLLAAPVAAADLNMAGQGALIVGTVEHDGSTWAEFRMSSGGYIPDGSQSFGAEATVVKHAFLRVAPHEAGELAEAINVWRRAPHNQNIYGVYDGAINLVLTGSDGVTFNPSYQPIVVVAIQEWAAVGSRGHVHGGSYVALTRAQAAALSNALTAFSLNPVASSELLFQANAQ